MAWPACSTTCAVGRWKQQQNRVLEDLREGLAEDAGMCGIADTAAVPRDLVVDAAG